MPAIIKTAAPIRKKQTIKQDIITSTSSITGFAGSFREGSCNSSYEGQPSGPAGNDLVNGTTRNSRGGTYDFIECERE